MTTSQVPRRVSLPAHDAACSAVQAWLSSKLDGVVRFETARGLPTRYTPGTTDDVVAAVRLRERPVVVLDAPTGLAEYTHL